jgi:hypothetical protein
LTSACCSQGEGEFDGVGVGVELIVGEAVGVDEVDGADDNEADGVGETDTLAAGDGMSEGELVADGEGSIQPRRLSLLDLGMPIHAPSAKKARVSMATASSLKAVVLTVVALIHVAVVMLGCITSQ